MGTLTVRNIPDEALARFRVRAAEDGCSMEAQARRLIETYGEGARPRPSFAEGAERARDILREAFGGRIPDDLVEDYLADRRATAARGE